MSSKARLAWVLAAAMLATPALAQDADKYDEDRPPRRATKIPTEGFWPTPKMMDRVINRIVDEMADHYDFDDSQLELTRELISARFPEFLNENRAEIQTLMNEYFEALLDDGPPTIEDVAGWAQRVQPLVAEFGEATREVTESMHEYLTDEQQTLLGAQTAAFETGMTMMQNKLSVWSAGGYDPETEWIHRDSSRREREAAEAAGSEAADSEESPSGERHAASTLTDEWAIYTERFIERYKLNNEQQQKARSFLRRQQEARDRYLKRKAGEMAAVTDHLQGAETEEERETALASYDRLNAPVGRMFEQLKERLDTLPTRAQRRAAVEAGLEPDEHEEIESPEAVDPATTKPTESPP